MHTLARSGRRRTLWHRLAVLAAAIALPAMAAPDAQVVSGTDTIVIPFAAIEGRAPVLSANTASPAFAAPPAPVASVDVPAPLALAGAGPAALSLRVAGSPVDRLRAEQCMTMAIYYEAASESDDGQRAVAQVVLNRVRHPQYPATVCGVVFQGAERSDGCQFSFTCDGSLARRPGAAPYARAARLAREALSGAVFAPVGLATHYHTTAVHPYWAPTLTQVGTIGAHRFYRWRGTAGTPQAFVAQYTGGEPRPERLYATARQVVRPVATGHTYVPPVAPASISAARSGSAVEPIAPAALASENLPGGGSVREGYARSGQWIRTP